MKLTENSMKKLFSVILCGTLIFSGCSAFRSSTQSVSVTTDHPDAEIYINGMLAGRGVASMPVKRDENVQIMARKDGYIPMQKSIGHSLNTTGILDIIGGCLILVPFFGLLAAGSQSLDENHVSVMMLKS